MSFSTQMVPYQFVSWLQSKTYMYQQPKKWDTLERMIKNWNWAFTNTFSSSFQTTCQEVTAISPILHMWDMRAGEVDWHSWSHTDSRWSAGNGTWSWAPEVACLNTQWHHQEDPSQPVMRARGRDTNRLRVSAGLRWARPPRSQTCAQS